MHKRAEEVTVNKDSVYERNPEMMDNKDQYPKYPRRKDWERSLITLKRKLNTFGKNESNQLPGISNPPAGAGTASNKESYA